MELNSEKVLMGLEYMLPKMLSLFVELGYVLILYNINVCLHSIVFMICFFLYCLQHGTQKFQFGCSCSIMTIRTVLAVQVIMEIPLELMLTISQKLPWMFFPDIIPLGHPIFDIINSTNPEVNVWSYILFSVWWLIFVSTKKCLFIIYPPFVVLSFLKYFGASYPVLLSYQSC